VEKERAALVDGLSKKLAKNELSDLVTKSLSFRLGRMSSEEYYSYLRDVAKKAGMDLKDSPNLAKYIDYLILFAKIDKEALVEEADKLEGAIKEKMFANDDQRQLDRMGKDLDVLGKLFDLKLNIRDYRYFKDRIDQFRSKSFLEFARKFAPQYGIFVPAAKSMPAIDDNIGTVENFYDVATKRDEVLVKNMVERMDKDGVDRLVMVTGGFHTQGISQQLKAKGFSYMVITPRITKFDVESPYIDVMSGKKTALEAVLSGEDVGKNTLAPDNKLNDEKFVKVFGAMAKLEEALDARDPAAIQTALSGLTGRKDVLVKTDADGSFYYYFGKPAEAPGVIYRIVPNTNLGAAPFAGLIPNIVDMVAAAKVPEAEKVIAGKYTVQVYAGETQVRDYLAKLTASPSKGPARIAAGTFGNPLDAEDENNILEYLTNPANSADMPQGLTPAQKQILELAPSPAYALVLLKPQPDSPDPKKIVLGEKKAYACGRDNTIFITAAAFASTDPAVLAKVLNGIKHEKKEMELLARKPAGLDPEKSRQYDRYAHMVAVREQVGSGEITPKEYIDELNDLISNMNSQDMFTRTLAVTRALDYVSNTNAKIRQIEENEFFKKDPATLAFAVNNARIINAYLLLGVFAPDVQKISVDGNAVVFELKNASGVELTVRVSPSLDTYRIEAGSGTYLASDIGSLSTAPDMYLACNPELAKYRGFSVNLGQVFSSRDTFLEYIRSRFLTAVPPVSPKPGEKAADAYDRLAKEKNAYQEPLEGAPTVDLEPAEDLGRYIDEAENAILEGRVMNHLLWAGAATRAKQILGGGAKAFFNPVNDIMSLSQEELDKIAPEEKNPLQGLLGRDDVAVQETVALGPRQIIQYRLELERLAKKKGKDVNEVLAKQKFLVVANDQTDQKIVDLFVGANFFGFDPKNILFQVQPTFPGFEFVDGEWREVKLSAFPYGHGYTKVQTALPEMAFYVDREGDRHSVEQSPIDYFRKGIAPEKTMLSNNWNIDDLVRLGGEYQGKPLSNIDVRRLAMVYKLMEKEGHSFVVETVINEKGQKGGGWFKPVDGGPSLLVESVQLGRGPNANINFMGVDLNRMNNYGNAAVEAENLPLTGLPFYLVAKEFEGRPVMILESITGDITRMPGFYGKTAAFKEPGVTILTFKKVADTVVTMQRMNAQEKDPEFIRLVKEIYGEKAAMPAVATPAELYEKEIRPRVPEQFKDLRIEPADLLDFWSNANLSSQIIDGDQFDGISIFFSAVVKDKDGKPVEISDDDFKKIMQAKLRVVVESEWKPLMIDVGLIQLAKRNEQGLYGDAVNKPGIKRFQISIGIEKVKNILRRKGITGTVIMKASAWIMLPGQKEGVWYNPSPVNLDPTKGLINQFGDAILKLTVNKPALGPNPTRGMDTKSSARLVKAYLDTGAGGELYQVLQLLEASADAHAAEQKPEKDRSAGEKALLAEYKGAFADAVFLLDAIGAELKRDLPKLQLLMEAMKGMSADKKQALLDKALPAYIAELEAKKAGEYMRGEKDALPVAKALLAVAKLSGDLSKGAVAGASTVVRPGAGEIEVSGKAVAMGKELKDLVADSGLESMTMDGKLAAEGNVEKVLLELATRKQISDAEKGIFDQLLKAKMQGEQLNIDIRLIAEISRADGKIVDIKNRGVGFSKLLEHLAKSGVQVNIVSDLRDKESCPATEDEAKEVIGRAEGVRKDMLEQLIKENRLNIIIAKDADDAIAQANAKKTVEKGKRRFLVDEKAKDYPAALKKQDFPYLVGRPGVSIAALVTVIMTVDNPFDSAEVRTALKALGFDDAAIAEYKEQGIPPAKQTESMLKYLYNNPRAFEIAA